MFLKIIEMNKILINSSLMLDFIIIMAAIIKILKMKIRLDYSKNKKIYLLYIFSIDILNKIYNSKYQIIFYRFLL